MSSFMRRGISPLLLILCCPPIVMLLWYINTHLGGSLSALFVKISNKGLMSVLFEVWGPVFFGSVMAWKMIIGFVLFEYALLRFLPGKTYKGPITPKGNIPQYTANGVAAYFITICSFMFFGFYLRWFSPAVIYDHFGEIIGALNGMSLLVCLGFYFKGRFYPSSTDSGISGHFIFDYYWGTELYPMLGKINLKMFINCRLGMMSWGILIISFAAKQTELYGLSNSMLIAVSLQLIYITKFYIWETGYLASLDIMHDRAGYYICWGCLVWVPGFYTSPTLYLVNHPNNLNTWLALTIFLCGVASISINYLADRQRQQVRRKEGNCKVWGKKPKLIVAKYTTLEGDEKQSILLSSGWWGISRHFHYLPEIAGAFFWTLPALFVDITPYFYVVFLMILLFERAFRDDKRCGAKYGEYWQDYCQLVPYKIIPYLI
jgi:7-dehydrocholesterol reductase